MSLKADDVESKLIELARSSPYYFIWYVSGHQPATHHVKWLKLLFSEEHTRINIVAPRESAKTTILVYSLLWLMSINPLWTNAIVSVSKSQARERLTLIRTIIETNQRYRNVFPHIFIDENRSSTQDTFSLWDSSYPSYAAWMTEVTQKGSLKDPTLFVTGALGKGFIGRRISGWLVMDDIVDESLSNPAGQDKMMSYIMTTLEPCIKASGKIINIGTRWIINDVYERLMNNPKWTSSVTRGITYNEDGQPVSYWPEFWSLERLEDKRRIINDDRIFGVMYLCDVHANALELFNSKTASKDIPHPLPPFIGVYVSTDWATSTKERADYTVFAALGVDALHNIYLLDMERRKEPIDTLMESFYAFVDRTSALYGRLDAVITENVAFQSVIYGLVASARPDIPIVGIVPKGDKTQRARVLANYALNDKFYVNQRIDPYVLKALNDELVNFGIHPHDDTVDALSLLFQHTKLISVEAKVVKVFPGKRLTRI